MQQLMLINFLVWYLWGSHENSLLQFPTLVTAKHYNAEATLARTASSKWLSMVWMLIQASLRDMGLLFLAVLAWGLTFGLVECRRAKTVWGSDSSNPIILLCLFLMRWRPALRSGAVLIPLRGIYHNKPLTWASQFYTSISGLHEHVSVKFFAGHLSHWPRSTSVQLLPSPILSVLVWCRKAPPSFFSFNFSLSVAEDSESL